MGAREKWFFKEGDKIYQHSENDGWAYMKRGPQESEKYIGTVDELKNGVHWESILRDIPSLNEKELN